MQGVRSLLTTAYNYIAHTHPLFYHENSRCDFRALYLTPTAVPWLPSIWGCWVCLQSAQTPPELQVGSGAAAVLMVWGQSVGLAEPLCALHYSRYVAPAASCTCGTKGMLAKRWICFFQAGLACMAEPPKGTRGFPKHLDFLGACCAALPRLHTAMLVQS